MSALTRHDAGVQGLSPPDTSLVGPGTPRLETA